MGHDQVVSHTQDCDSWTFIDVPSGSALAFLSQSCVPVGRWPVADGASSAAGPAVSDARLECSSARTLQCPGWVPVPSWASPHREVASSTDEFPSFTWGCVLTFAWFLSVVMSNSFTVSFPSHPEKTKVLALELSPQDH